MQTEWLCPIEFEGYQIYHPQSGWTMAAGRPPVRSSGRWPVEPSADGLLNAGRLNPDPTRTAGWATLGAAEWPGCVAA